MSELINNQEKRQKLLKSLIMRLHDGDDFDAVKKEFEENFSDVSAKEITTLEQALIKDGLGVDKIQKLCDVHAAVFKGSIEEIHSPTNEYEVSGHPVHTFLMENTYIENKIEDIKKSVKENNVEQSLVQLKALTEIDKHYARKENVIFPYLEKHDITGPPQVMWAIDDEVRAELKEIIKNVTADKALSTHEKSINDTLFKISEMVFKENKILVPMVLETFSTKEWVEIEQSSDEFGYSFTKVVKNWKPILDEKEENNNDLKPILDQVMFSAGSLTREEVNAMLNTMPVDITFVDANGKVKYFSEGPERIFPRPKSVIGREVRNCHPPASVHIVEALVAELKQGKKDHEDFWLKMGDKMVYIRYFAVRNKSGKFLGTLEVTQNIKNIMEIEGEKRLVNS